MTSSAARQYNKTWKQEWATKKVCRGGVRKVKAHLELTLTKDIKGSKKSFYCYITSK